MILMHSGCSSPRNSSRCRYIKSPPSANHPKHRLPPIDTDCQLASAMLAKETIRKLQQQISILSLTHPDKRHLHYRRVGPVCDFTKPLHRQSSLRGWPRRPRHVHRASRVLEGRSWDCRCRYTPDTGRRDERASPPERSTSPLGH